MIKIISMMILGVLLALNAQDAPADEPVRRKSGAVQWKAIPAPKLRPGSVTGQVRQVTGRAATDGPTAQSVSGTVSGSKVWAVTPIDLPEHKDEKPAEILLIE